MLRLREEVVTNSRKDGFTEQSATYSNQIAYKIGAKMKPNDQVALQFELGNDWNGTEQVQGIPGNYLGKRNALTPWFSLACVQPCLCTMGPRLYACCGRNHSGKRYCAYGHAGQFNSYQ
jgi:hypothetical protein